MRHALGAGRGRLVRQFLTEALLLSVMSGALGVLGAVAGVDALLALAPASLPRLEDVPLVEAVLAQREAGVDRRRMDGRRRREARRPPLDVGTGEERMVGVPFEETPPERIEVDEGDPRVLGELRLDQPGQLVEAAAQSSCSTG